MQTFARQNERHPVSRKRRGSVLLVVVGLLGVLLLLGFMFFSFATYESNSAQSFSEAAKNHEPLGTDVLWDWALEQLILGPHDSLQQSALYSGRHSMIPNMYGNGRSPYTSGGINVILDASNNPVVDQDHDGMADADQSLLDIINYSAAANGGTVPTIPTDPSPGVDYTSPDINTMFLAYIGQALNNDSPPTFEPVIIPSFHRWQLTRAAGGTYDAGWTNSAGWGPKIMRPHPDHVIPGSGGTKRYLSAATGGVNPFPFSISPNTDGGYDIDLDGDGKLEAILIDLDFPVQELPDGRKYVPMFAFTIIDADGLINLNTAGNLAHYFGNLDNSSTPFGNNLPISRSNQGLTRSEVNPFWALRDPMAGSNAFPAAGDSKLDQYGKFFGSDPGDRVEMANMELWFLQNGRAEFDSSGNVIDLLVGRNGDRDRMNQGIDNGILATFHPEPGTPQLDDDDDDGNDAGEGDREDDDGEVIAMRPFGHPLDPSGGGNWLNLNNTATPPTPMGDQYGRKPAIGYVGPGPNRFLQYQNYHNRTGMVRWGQGLSGVPGCYGQLMLDKDGNTNISNAPATLANKWLDHPSEIIHARKILELQGYVPPDDIFDASQMEGLHRSDNDPDAVLHNTRLRQLMPFSFSRDPSIGDAQAAARGRQFTTISWDSRQWGLPAFSATGFRSWEYDGQFEFPPTTLSTGATLNAEEPIRPELRKILSSGNANQGMQIQYRWNINEFWSSSQNEGNAGSNAFPATGDIASIYNNPDAFQPYPRKLTAHPIDPGSASIPTTGPVPYPPQTPSQQEYWARRDRQQMARDIYVMLYLLGGAQDTTPYSTTSNTTFDSSSPPVLTGPLYSAAQCREMAQFAVNVVDALDPDDVMTAFEYDMNLADGWDVDDSPFAATTSDTADASGLRGAVSGVEAQTLTINESLVFRHGQVKDETTMMAEDHPATLLDDREVATPTTNDYRYFAYVELHNASPYVVSMNRSYQLAHLKVVDPTDSSLDIEKQVTIGGSSGGFTVQGGQVFTIGCRTHTGADIDPSTTQPYDSRFRMDPNWRKSTTTPPAFITLAPASGSLNLDLVAQTSDGRYRVTGQNGTDGSNDTTSTRGSFLNEMLAGDDNNKTLVLRRRLHPSRSAPGDYDTNPTSRAQYDADNPFVDVDRMVVEMKILHDPSGSLESLEDPDKTYASGNEADVEDLQPAAREIKSEERRDPLDGDDTRDQDHNTGMAFVANSLGNQQNSVVGPTGFFLWQPHFDRDFASVNELFSIPLYGSSMLTRKLSAAGVMVPYFPADTIVPYRTAQSRFLCPQNFGGLPDRTLDNRWYRLLEFVTVNDRMHRHRYENGTTVADVDLSPPGGASATPGKINLNTIRHRGVLFGLLDDPNYFQVADASGMGDFPTMDRVETGRDWYKQFLESRDNLDPDPAIALRVPGIPPKPSVATAKSRPFRSLAYMAADAQATSLPTTESIEATVLRSAPADSGLPPYLRRRLFDIGTNSNNFTTGDANFVDYYTRHRLLQKVINNSTTRSNVFICWIGVQFHEALESGTEDANGNGELDPGEDTNGNQILDKYIQVGAALPVADAPVHRMFCIIDRTVAEDAYDERTQKFNFRPMVVFQRTIE